jgi:hypothetical protein
LPHIRLHSYPVLGVSFYERTGHIYRLCPGEVPSIPRGEVWTLKTLKGRFCRKASGYNDSRTASGLRLKRVRRCAIKAFPMAGQRALLRFVNC